MASGCHARPSASSARSVTVAPAPSASTTITVEHRVPYPGSFAASPGRTNGEGSSANDEGAGLDVLDAGRAVFQHAFEKHDGVHPRRGSAHLLSQRRFPAKHFRPRMVQRGVTQPEHRPARAVVEMVGSDERRRRSVGDVAAIAEVGKL